MKRVATVLAIAILLAGVVSLPTDARTRRVPTQIDELITGLARGDGRAVAFEGSISSRKDKCLPQRTLRVTYADTNGQTVVFGESTTDEVGHWRVGGDGPEADYVFTVDKARRGKILCGADRLQF